MQVSCQWPRLKLYLIVGQLFLLSTFSIYLKDLSVSNRCTCINAAQKLRKMMGKLLLQLLIYLQGLKGNQVLHNFAAGGEWLQ